jgi:epoxyqueuosine reductase QueG
MSTRTSFKKIERRTSNIEHRTPNDVTLTVNRLRALVAEVAASKRISGERGKWWNPPLLATAAADGRFDVLPEITHPGHLLPADLLAGARSVIVYFLPFKRRLVASNLKGGLASRMWARSYLDTNHLIAEINTRIENYLSGLGFASAVTPATHNFSETDLVSGWSHKHIAVLSGLGLLGHHTQLITPAGCCGRIGSLVTQMNLGNHPVVEGEDEHCLHKRGQTCLACVKGCRFGPLTPEGFDRFGCYDQLMVNDRANADLPLTDVCGKCVSMVPCSFRIP